MSDTGDVTAFPAFAETLRKAQTIVNSDVRFKKLVEVVPSGKVVDEILDRDARSGENRSSAEDIGIAVDDLLGGHGAPVLFPGNAV